MPHIHLVFAREWELCLVLLDTAGTQSSTSLLQALWSQILQLSGELLGQWHFFYGCVRAVSFPGAGHHCGPEAPDEGQAADFTAVREGWARGCREGERGGRERVQVRHPGRSTPTELVNFLSDAQTKSSQHCKVRLTLHPEKGFPRRSGTQASLDRNDWWLWNHLLKCHSHGEVSRAVASSHRQDGRRQRDPVTHPAGGV